MAEHRLDSVDIGQVEFLDESTIDWTSASEVTYIIHQHIRYEYPGPITDLRQRLMISPRDGHGGQRRIVQRLDVFPQLPAETHGDAFGNSVISLTVARLDCGIDFEYWAIVEREAWVREHREARSVLEMPSLMRSSLLTRADENLREVAERLRAAHREPLELAHAINHFVFEHMEYAFGATDVYTTAAVAFHLGKGVCQDYAHVMLALARHCGLAARYVSGHLLGEGGTHAWVEIILPDRGDGLVIAFDPTHDRVVTMKYIVVAVGRDYADVAPTSGVFTAPFGGELSVRKRVGVTDVRYAA
ncbi:MAG: transglutaminase family protein [Candidatus Velthaea sp.]|jgi:transglutaminase-like putative cysteine protease